MIIPKTTSRGKPKIDNQISFSCSGFHKQLVQKWAHAEDRTVSQFLQRLIEQEAIRRSKTNGN